MKQYMVKVPGGKLLKLKIEIDGTKIKSIQILGDFFVYPEESLFELEKALLGVQREQCLDIISSAIAQQKMTLAGFSANDLNNLIQQAFEEHT